MKEELRGRIINILTLVLLLAIIGFGVACAYPHWRNSKDLKRREAELQLRIDAKKREINKLLENQKRFKTDPDFVEAIARRNRRVFPGELVFIFED